MTAEGGEHDTPVLKPIDTTSPIKKPTVEAARTFMNCFVVVMKLWVCRLPCRSEKLVTRVEKGDR